MIYDKIRFFDFIKPALNGGKYTISSVQNIIAPEKDAFSEAESFYVSSRAYTLDQEDVFSTSPAENECGDLSKIIPFITFKNKYFPWIYKIKEDINNVPVPWIALIVISSQEQTEECDITVDELINNVPSGVYFPDKKNLPKVAVESGDTVCHVLDMPVELYKSVMPSFEDMTYLSRGLRINLADTEDKISAMDGDFSSIMANRFIPTGDVEPLKSTVHLVSMLGIPSEIPSGFDKVRLVSLYRFNVFSVKDNTETFTALIEGLKKNTGAIGFEQNNEVLKKCYVPKKHYTRTGEFTYSLYRSPLIPYENHKLDCTSKHTADGHLIYNAEKGIFDVSYAAAFQIGRLMALSRKSEANRILSARKKRRLKVHKELLDMSIGKIDIYEIIGGLLNNTKG